MRWDNKEDRPAVPARHRLNPFVFNAAIPADRWGVHAVAFSPDGRLLASGGGEEFVRLWDPASGKRVATLHGRFGNGRSLAFSADGKTLAAGGTARVIILWDVALSKPRQE